MILHSVCTLVYEFGNNQNNKSCRWLQHSSEWKNLNILLVMCRSAILHGYKYIYGKVVLDVGAGTGDCHLLTAAFTSKTCCVDQ